MAAARSRYSAGLASLAPFLWLPALAVGLCTTSAFAQTDAAGTAPAANPNTPTAPVNAPPNVPQGQGTGPGDSPMNAVPTVRRVQDPSTSGSLVPSGQTAQPGALDSAKDKDDLAAQGQARPGITTSYDPGLSSIPSRVYADDWWSHVHPVVELHGYFRTRGEMYHNFSLGRGDATGALWPHPLDDTYQQIDANGQVGQNAQTIALCGKSGTSNCTDKTQAFANMRLRLNPELHVSDNLRVMAQIDALDNVVLGSSPADYGNAGTSQRSVQGAQNDTQNSPSSSISVKRVWAEYTTPVGQLRFGRMPTHWGLGMLYNDGNGVDQDYQSNNDRIQLITGLRSIDLYAGGSWDFANSGATSATPLDANSADTTGLPINYANGGQPYNTANRMNAGQWTLFVARRTNPELQRSRLVRGNVVVNGGLYNVLRIQGLDYAKTQTAPTYSVNNNNLERRGLTVYTPDVWIQVLWRKLRLEAEGAAHIGQVAQTSDYQIDLSTGTNKDPVKIRQFGFAAQAEYRAVEDKLQLQFGTGWASGDPWASSLKTNSATELNNGKGPISTFAFNPAYNIDLIFHRNLMQRVQGTYYFRPSVAYDFIRNPNGQKFGGGATFIWTRASEFVQTPGSKRDLGVEIDLQVYYQAKDGTLNDDPTKMGGFYAMLQYGAFFPLGGLQYPSATTTVNGTTTTTATTSTLASVSTAQAIRLHLGVVF